MKAYIVFYDAWRDGYGTAIFIKGVYTDYNKAKEVCSTMDGYIEEIEIDHEYDTCYDAKDYIYGDLYEGNPGNIKYIGGYQE
ncbi:MAG: hypothetical protein J6Y02_23790 [Pseudobutyrivibrio sp.]|nr:hypothetical protein [Pseudobutyrivibrio sp.]